MIQKFTLAFAFVVVFISNSFSQAPANDVCANAISLTVNGGWTSTSNANTVTNAANPSCGGSSAIRDVWFKFVYGGGTVSIATQLGTNTDTRIAVYTSCGGTQLACNDDITGSLTSLITLSCPTLVLGNTYYIHWDGRCAPELPVRLGELLATLPE